MEPGAVAASQLLEEGRHGVMCLEAGGPEPGLGCGGRGVARAIELMEETELLESGGFDVAVFDVLGDVVCGGFAAPLRQGFARKVVIVASEEPMALFAANNIAKAVVTYESNGVVLAGLVANLRSGKDEAGLVERFAEAIGTEVLVVLPRDPLVIEAERKCMTVLEHAPESDAARELSKLGETLAKVSADEVKTPTPLDETAFFELLK